MSVIHHKAVFSGGIVDVYDGCILFKTMIIFHLICVLDVSWLLGHLIL